MFKEIVRYLLPSLDVTTVGGASARKLSALWMIILVTLLEFTYVIVSLIKGRDLIYLMEMIYSDLLFAATCLGMTLVRDKNKTDEQDSNK